MASGGADESVRIWEASTGHQLHTLMGHTNWVRTLAFSPSGARLLSGSVSGGRSMTKHDYCNHD